MDRDFLRGTNMAKLSLRLLRKYIFSRVGLRDKDVIIGPAYGEDAAIISLNNKVLVAHVDPITGAVENIGWLAVHIACNDIAVRGAKPRWLLAVYYLPEDCDEGLIDRITGQVDRAARELGAMIVGGHTEFTPGISRPLISMTALGIAEKERFVSTGNVRPGDVILMTKTAGVEGTSVLASDFRELLLKKGISEALLKRAALFIRHISVVKEALTLSELEVHSMHDPTEGGILGGLAEMAYASNVLIEAWEKSIPIAEETRVLCGALSLDPLKILGSGTLLAAIPEDEAEEATKRLSELGIKSSIIGVARDGRGVRVHRKNGKVEEVGEVVKDEIMELWKSKD